MKVVVLNGSPRTGGNTSVLTQAFAAAALAKGHTVEEFNPYALEISGCIACGACKRSKDTMCAVQDDFQQVLASIQACDCIIFATPVYFGQMTGPLKSVIDRFYCFANGQFNLRDLPGKKFGVITVSGAPAHVFESLANKYFTEWFNKFLGLELVGTVVCGGYEGAGDSGKDEESLAKVRELAEKL